MAVKTKKVIVNLTPSYTAYIGENAIGKLKKIIEAYRPRFPVIVTNNRVWELWGRVIQKEVNGLFSLGKNVFILPDGEKAKSFNWYKRILEFLVDVDKNKSSVVVIALGGGAVGDVSGFAAGTYRRGVPVIQVPTTLLSQVDSCLGGKTAINLAKAKNMVGIYHQPSAIVVDTRFLRTLSKSNIVEGMAEVIKYGLIWDYDFLEYLEKITKNMCEGKLNWDKIDWVEVAYRSLKVKSEIVSLDERETEGLRFFLNFGHTVGHVIEWMSRIPHGKAVALGMIVAMRISQKRKLISSQDVDRIIDLLKLWHLPIVWRTKRFSWDVFWDILNRDKKFLGGKFRFVLLNGIGEAKVVSDVSKKEIMWAVGQILAY